MAVQLRPHQIKGVADLRDALRDGTKRVLYVLPTGGGKTWTFVKGIIEPAIQRGKTAWVIVPKLALVEQTLEKLDALGIPAGVIQGTHNRQNYSLPVQVCSKDSIVPRLKKGLSIQAPEVIIHDEAHHLTDDNTFGWLANQFPQSFQIGFTATPCRLDGRGLGRIFQKMIVGPSITELMAMGFLIPAVHYKAPVDLASVRKSSTGDYNLKDLEEWALQNKIVGDCIREYKEKALYRRAIGFSPTVAHAARMAELFRENGIPAAYIEAKTKPEERKRLIADLKERRIYVLMSVGVFTEGFDCPAVECLLLTRPTESLQLYIQMAGRGIRPEHGMATPGEHCIFLDHANLYYRHGLITDPRDFSLDDGVLPKKTERLYECPVCHGEMKSFPIACPHCGHPLREEEAEQCQIPVPEEIVTTDHKLEAANEKEHKALLEAKKQERRQYYAELESVGMFHNWAPHKVGVEFKKRFGEFPTRSDRKDAKGLLEWHCDETGKWKMSWKQESLAGYGEQ